ncbi:hypothetical protein RND81_06G129700 [Saponaria officinalis]|uniref:Uncharacterized protein n=1 Tax=Saponaria officinalis TaxID=3572 RepID=A0AAW1KCI2_SAPOF
MLMDQPKTLSNSPTQQRHSPRTKTPNVPASTSSPTHLQTSLQPTNTTSSPYERKPNLRAHKSLNVQSCPLINEELNLIPSSTSFQQSWDLNPTLKALTPKKHVTQPLSLRKSPRFQSNLSHSSNPSQISCPKKTACDINYKAKLRHFSGTA